MNQTTSRPGVCESMLVGFDKCIVVLVTVVLSVASSDVLVGSILALVAFWELARSSVGAMCAVLLAVMAIRLWCLNKVS